MSDVKNDSAVTGVINTFTQSYGPYAFSLVTFLSLWFAAVKPELDRREISTIEQREMLKQMTAVASTMERTSDTLERIAIMRNTNE